MANKHLYLRNEPGSTDGFRKGRFVQVDSPEAADERQKIPNEAQQDRLRKAHVLYYQERKLRLEKKDFKVPEVQLARIKFFTVFNNDLQKKFYSKYGLLVANFEDFNKTVLLEIVDQTLFSDFAKHLELFYTSEKGVSYEGKEYNLIALIHSFVFLSTKRRIKSYDGTVSGIGLVPSQTKNDNIVYEELIKYLKSKGKTIHFNQTTNEFFEVESLAPEEIETIADNFDIVKSITSSRTERRRPGQFGEERRDYGFSVTVKENLPIIGVIDTGVTRIEPLRMCITDINYNLTNLSPYWDENGHGTAVASLIVLGEEFIAEIKNTYEAKAKIAVIKAIHNDNDSLNISLLADSIRKANAEHGIRIFNLSLNDPLPKPYNSAISDYAFLLDQIAYELDILIIMSVGNIPENRLQELRNERHLSHEYPQIFYSLNGGSNIHSCETTNIAEPSESYNNISVGALAGNLEDRLNSDITPGEELPAYYTRKFHYDYEQSINGTDFIRSQKNKYLNKPDLTFEGGDLFAFEAGIEILRSPIPQNGQRYFSRSCGTSFAAPLIVSYAAEILSEYPILRTQTVKAMLINSAISPCGANPPKFREFEIDLLKKLIGFGRPQREGLVKTDNNSVTFIIESEIELEDLQTIPLVLPKYINKSGNKLNFKASLAYSFKPIKGNHLAYLPVQITFGIFKPIEAEQMGNSKTEDYRIKPGITWSDDFFGVDNRMFSNIQRLNFNLSGETIEALGNALSIGIKCTGKKEIPSEERKHLENSTHKFSLVITVTEMPLAKASNNLYQELVAVNTVEAIADIEGTAILDAEN